MNNFDTLYQTLMLEFSEAAIKKFVLKFKDEAPEETIRKELEDFERYKSRMPIKDPNQYDSWTSLYKAVSSARDVSQTEKGTKKTSNSSESGLGPNLAKPEDANVLEIYEGDSEDKCILYGKGYSFCISRQAGGNMYDTYRTDKSSTFYFIYFKDKSKNENDHIMVLDHTERGYEWTFNDNKTQRVEGGWDEIVEKYPILGKYRDIFVNKKLSDVERERIQTIRTFRANPTLTLFESFDHKTKIKALRSMYLDLPDEIFKTLNHFLINEFISVGPNLTDYQADYLKPNQVRWYIENREQSMPDLFSASGFKYNKHDANVPYMIKIIDKDQKTAEDRISSYKEEIKNYKPSENKSIFSRPGISFTGLYLTKLPSGIPDVILGGFGTAGTLITSLEGGPTYVGGVFVCGNNIQSLKGAPKYVGGFFECGSTKITSLEGAPRYVGTYFSCKNTKITSLKDAPKYVGGNFNCNETLITTLEGAPTYVGGEFECRDIPTLVSLEGAPRRIGGGINYINTNASAKGAPKEIGGDLNISDIEFTPEEEALLDAIKLRSERMKEWGRQFSSSLQTKIKNLVFQKSMITESRKYSQIQLLENLRDWFQPHVDKKGKKFKGWINCKTGGPCGRKNTSKGSYPACRPTKAQCKNIKGKMYKKKSSKRVNWKKKSS